jgi:hypothetical protein
LLNFFDPTDNAVLHALQNPRVNTAGSDAPICHPCLTNSHRLVFPASFVDSERSV